MLARRFCLALSISSALLLAACQKEPSPPARSPAAKAPAQEAAPPTPEAAPEAAPAEDMGKLTYEVYERFKKSFPQTADFKSAPVVIRIEPATGVELFEIITPNGVFYTNRQATWIIEGVLMMQSPGQDPAAAQQAAAAGLPPPMVNVTMRPDAQRLYALVRDKEAAARATGSENMSPVEIYKSMPRDKAIVLDYGRPDHEVILLADLLDPASHKFFHELSKQDPAQVNLRLSVFPVGVEEIRPQAIAHAAALLCVGFDPANPTAQNADKVATLWKSFMSDSIALANPEQAWGPWAQANGIVSPAPEACPRNIEPGIFTRLASSLGLFGTPLALLPNGKAMSNEISLEKIRAALAAPAETTAPAAAQPPAAQPQSAVPAPTSP